MKKLAGKNIVVTGGTSGIGEVSAINLAENCASFVIDSGLTI